LLASYMRKWACSVGRVAFGRPALSSGAHAESLGA